jgi:hypothetical protein
VIIAADPVETGIVASLARPGGNITGVSLMSAVFVGKCVELFRDMLAAARKVAVITNAADPLFAKLALDQVDLAGRLTGIQIQPITVRGPDEELDVAFAAMVRGKADAVVIQGSLSTQRIADLALAHRLPAASTTRAFVDAGGLMSYGADGPALFRHGAKFVQRILQGRQPNDLPIEQPTKFELGCQSQDRQGNGPHNFGSVLAPRRCIARMKRQLLRCMSPELADFVAKVCDERSNASSARRSMTFRFAARSLGSGGFDAWLVLTLA